MVALLAYSFLQVGLYGAFGPGAQAEAQAHLHLNAPWTRGRPGSESTSCIYYA